MIGQPRGMRIVGSPKGLISYGRLGGLFTVYEGLLTDPNDGWENMTFIHRLAASDLGPGSGNVIRITTEFSEWQAGGSMVGFVGQRAAAGDPYDFLGTPATMLWGGLSTLAATGTNLVNTTDFITLPEAFDSGKDYLFSYFFANVPIVGIVWNPGAVGAIAGESYFKFGVNEASVVNKSGFTTDGVGLRQFVSKVEVNTV